MRSYIFRYAAAIAMASAFITTTSESAGARDHGRRAAAAVGGLIVGAAIADAISPRKKIVENVYVVAPAQPTAAPYSPAAGVVCYPNQRACYTVGGGYDPRWTWNVYAK